MKEDKKSRGALWIIGTVLVLAAVVAAGSIYSSVRPQWKVAKGLMNLSRELAGYRNPVLEEADLEELLEKWQEGNVHTISEMDVTFSKNRESTLGLRLDKSIDREKTLLQADADICVLGKELMKLQVAMEGRDLYLTLPALSQKSLKVNADTLVEEFNSSILAKLTGWAVPEDYLTFLFGQITDGMQEEDTLKTAQTLLAGAFTMGNFGGETEQNDVRDFLEEIEIIDTKKSITIENSWENIDCDGYEIRISAEVMDEIFGQIGQMLGVDDAPEGQDIVLDIYLDKQNRIMRIATVQPLADVANGREIEFVLDLRGEERTADKILMTVNVVEPVQGEASRAAELELTFQGLPGRDGCNVWVSAAWKPVEGTWPEEVFWSEEGSFTVTNSWTYETKAFTIRAEYAKDGTTLACDAKGSFGEIVSGESIKVHLDSLSILREGKEFCKLSGSYFLEPLREEIVLPQNSISFGK